VARKHRRHPRLRHQRRRRARYFAYAEAARGRSYASYFVRTAEDWRKAFAAAEPYRPDAWPDVIPKQALVPYRDYLVEYPPGFFLAALPPSWVAHDATATSGGSKR